MVNRQDDREQIGRRLKAAREMAGLSQGQVARLLQMHRPTISEIEAGRRRVTADELVRFADVYDVSLDWLTRNSETTNGRSAEVELAARELAKLSPEDMQHLLDLLRSLRDRD